MPAVLKRLADHSLLISAAADIENLTHLSPDLSATLAKACRRRQPVRTVTALAEDVLGGNRPHDFIDWLLVAHAVAHGHPKESSTHAAQRLGVDEATLAAAIRRRFGNVTLSALAEGGSEVLLDNLRKLLGVSTTTSDLGGS